MSALDDADEAMTRGRCARREGRLDDARAAFGEAAAVFRNVEAQAETAGALTALAQIERDMANLDRALEYQAAALAITRTLDNTETLAHVIRHMGDILQASDRHQEADPYYREMLAIYRANSDGKPLDLANAVRSMALHEEYLGDIGAARRLWQEARERYGALDSLFLSLTGKDENPGVAEADQHLGALKN